MPGIDLYGDSSTIRAQKLTPEQAKNLHDGSFEKVGGAIMQATINATNEFELEPKFVVLGTSMSAAISASALKTAGEMGIDIRGATFTEPSNTVKRSLVKLGSLFVLAARTAGGYTAMNPPILREVNEPVVTIAKRFFKPTNYLYGRAVASSSLIDDLGPIDFLEGVPVFTSRGAGSNISPEKAFEDLNNHLNQVAELDTRVYGNRKTNPHDHGYALAVQAFIDAVKNVLDR